MGYISVANRLYSQVKTSLRPLAVLKRLFLVISNSAILSLES